LEVLRGNDPPLSKKIQASMWGVETLTNLDAQNRDRLFESLTVDTLALLIQGVDAQLADRWLAGMPSDLAVQVRDKQASNDALCEGEFAAYRLARQQLAAVLAVLDDIGYKRNDRSDGSPRRVKAGVG
jgi:hypothetical protein